MRGSWVVFGPATVWYNHQLHEVPEYFCDPEKTLYCSSVTPISSSALLKQNSFTEVLSPGEVCKCVRVG